MTTETPKPEPVPNCVVPLRTPLPEFQEMIPGSRRLVATLWLKDWISPCAICERIHAVGRVFYMDEETQLPVCTACLDLGAYAERCDEGEAAVWWTTCGRRCYPYEFMPSEDPELSVSPPCSHGNYHHNANCDCLGEVK